MSIYKNGDKILNSITAIEEAKVKEIVGNEMTDKGVCTTKVADVPLTEVSIPDGLFSSKNPVSYIKYEVVNGIAFVYINIREGKFVNSGESRNIIVPKMKSPFNYTITGEDYRCNLSILANGNNMQIWSLGDVAVTTNYGCCISYPVAE